MPIRPIRRSDYEALNRLHRRVGWPERSPAGWRWLEENPARTEIRAPVGWVEVDEGDQPVAMVGNFVQRFHHGPRILHGATGFSIIVPPERKGASRGLIRAFLAQKGLFARYTFNANARSAPLYSRFGMAPFPLGTAGLKLSWVVDRLACAQGRLLRRLLGRISAETARKFGERLLNGRLFHSDALTLPPEMVVVRDLSERSAYADFWRTLVEEGRLLSDRSPAVLRWRLADPDATTPPVMLGLMRGGRMVGFALAHVAKTNLIDPPSLEILDLTALRSSPDAIETLAGALIANARAVGAAKVRLQLATPDLLDQLGGLAARARREGGWGHGHAIVDDPAHADAWAPTPFDGDYGVCLRPVPRPKRRGKAAARPALATGRLSKA